MIIYASASPLRQAVAQTPVVPLNTLYTWLPAITDDKVDPVNNFAQTPGGRAGLLTVELEDDYSAVQVGVENQFTNSWTLSQVVLAPSANFGPNPVVGSAAYDLDGSQIDQMVPVQWSNAGANSNPPGNFSMALPTSAAASPGQSVLSFTSTTSAPAYGSVQPAAGWYVADGLGCIASGTTVTSVAPASIGLSAPVSGAGCGTGQSIYFSAQSFGPLGQTIAGSSQAGSLSFAFSDWIPLTSLPRSDAGFSVGANVAGSGIRAGTTLAGFTPNTLMLSAPLQTAMRAHAAVTISVSQATVGNTPTGSVTFNVSATAGIHPGQTVTAAGSLAPHTHVLSVGGQSVTLDQATTGPIPGGTSVSFVNTTWISAPGSAGATTLSVPSTSTRPLLHLRYFTTGPGSVTIHSPGCMRNTVTDSIPCEAPLGLPQVWSSVGGASAGQPPIDGVNYVSQIAGGPGSAQAEARYPTFFLRFLGRHGGATLLICGGFQASGAAGSVSGEASPGRIGAAWATNANPSLPVAAVDVGSGHLNTSEDFGNCVASLQYLAPSMVLIQDYSNHNVTPVDSYLPQVKSVAQYALGLGIQPIIYLAYVENSADVGALPVAARVANSTNVPLATGLGRQVAGVSTLVTGPGIPAGTVATPVLGAWNLQLSQPATIPSGSVIHLAMQISSIGGNTVMLTMPSYMTSLGLTVSPQGSRANTAIALTRGSVKATTSAANQLQAGTYLPLSHTTKSVTENYSEAGTQLLGATDPWDSVQLDAMDTVGTDPNNQYWLCEGCTTVGPYANDYGNSIIASVFQTLLQQLTGQSQ